MKTLLLIIVLFLNTISKADIIVVPMGDILFEVPNFEAPKFNLGFPEQKELKVKEKQKLKMQDKLVKTIRVTYPNAKNIIIFNGNLIITL